MARLHRLFGLFLVVAVIGLATLTRAQEPSEPPSQGQGQGQGQPADTGAAVQPAPDADLAAEVQQMRTEIEQLKGQVAQLTSVVQDLQAAQAAPAAAPPKPTPPAPAKAAAMPRSKKTPATAGKKSPTPAPAAVTPTADETPASTVLVFQDGHRVEARNYAIVGQTLWIYTEDDSKKMPLSELDVTATKNANSDRGIVFQLPPSK